MEKAKIAVFVSGGGTNLQALIDARGSVITSGEISAVMPSIMHVLNIFDPTTLPMAISALPWNDDMKLTTISGDDVPMPTIVSPIMNSLSPNRLAMLEDPSTSQFAPSRMSIRPPMRVRI